ncbi:MAG TPA: BamA/TamA family outer membrane protein [Armatimonadota bacterium]
MNRISLLVALLMLTLGACTLPGFAQAPAEQPIIREVVFEGAKNITPQAQQQLNTAIKSKVGQPYSKETADADVENILRLGWFNRATYRTEPVKDGVRLIFTLVENPVINKIEFVGNTKLSSADLLKVVKTKPGEVLNREQVVNDALAITKAYADKGYQRVEVYDFNITNGTLQFYIFEPKIAEIRIDGAKKTHPKVIRRELEFKPGDVFNIYDVQRSVDNLNRLGIFQEVRALPEPGPEPGTITMVISVQEMRTGLAAVGIGHSNIEGLIGFIDVADTNLFGTGQRLSARFQFGADRSYELSYTNPWIDPHRTSFTANIYDRKILRQAVTPTETVTYDERRQGGSIIVARPVSRYTRLNLMFRNDDISGERNTPPPTPPAPDTFPQELLVSSTVRSIGPSLVYDNRDSLLDPTRGSYRSLGTEFAGLLGGANFTKLLGEDRQYWTVREIKRKAKTTGANATTAAAQAAKAPMKWVFASRAKMGTIGGDAPFLDQFLIGGADTLRGYEEDRFPGKNMVLINNELRIPINETLQTVLFVDAGDAWGGQFAADFGDTSFKLHVGYGVGIRVRTPIGPLRLDYGLNGEGGSQFHFGIGSTF